MYNRYSEISENNRVTLKALLQNVNYLHKIVFRTCASAVNKCDARHNRRKWKVGMLSLGIEFNQGSWLKLPKF